MNTTESNLEEGQNNIDSHSNSIKEPVPTSFRAYIVRSSVKLTDQEIKTELLSRGLAIRDIAFLTRKHANNPEFNGFIDCATLESRDYLIKTKQIVFTLIIFPCPFHPFLIS